MDFTSWDLETPRAWTEGSGQSEALRKIIMDALHLLEKQKDKSEQGCVCG